MAKKYYAVKIGKKPGVYLTWEECKKMVEGYPGATYKSFPSLVEANAFAGIKEENQQLSLFDQEAEEEASEKTEGAYAYVDGSFNIASQVYGYGGFLMHDGKKEVLQGSGDDPEMASMRNVAGEVMGSMAAMQKAIELGLKKITIYYDYAGIEMWATGNWKRNKRGTIAYYEYAMSVKDKLLVSFVKVKGHSGVEGNEEADFLAKQAVGIEK